MTIHTAKGEIELVAPSKELLQTLQKQMTYGVCPLKEVFQGAKYGLVVKCDDKELLCLKQQPAEVPQDIAAKMLYIHQMLILETYLRTAEQMDDAIYYATGYIKDKGEAGYESGIVHFIFPAAPKPKKEESVFARILSRKAKGGWLDPYLGEGAERHFGIFGKAFQEVKAHRGIGIQYFGLDIRRVSQLGQLQSGFMLHNGNFIYLGVHVEDDDPRFRLLAANGIKRIVHLPSVTLLIDSDKLPLTKGEEGVQS